MNRLKRLWDMSPRQVTRAVRRRVKLFRPPDLPPPSWHRIGSGPLAGAEIYVVPEAADTLRAMILGDHDQWLFDACTAFRPLDGLVCWDIGAHIGYHALAFASLVGAGGRVISFEPNPHNLARMEMHFARNPALASRITVEPVALSDQNGVAEFRFSDDVESTISSGGHLTSSMIPNESSLYASFGLTQVNTATIDELVASGKLPEPDVLKIDVEGAEGAVLRGGMDLIRRKRPLLLIEVHHILQMLEICQLLIGLGYRFELLAPQHVGPGHCFVIGRPE
jgi:FkbM family methyltransferase